MIDNTTLTQKLPESYGLYSKIVFEVLSKLERGSLTLVCPDGRTMAFGKTNEIECHLSVKSLHFFKRLVLYGDIGFGESYVLGEWESDDLTHLIRWMILNWESNAAISGSKVNSFLLGILRFSNRLKHLARRNNLEGSTKNIAAHYDLSNELFKSFLDPTMAYSCADFSNSIQSLEEAQILKFDRMARLARISQSDRVLEIGSGWGGFAIYLAKTYGCQVDSVTVSKNQFDYFQEKIHREDLKGQVRVHFMDYRKIQGNFDKIVSIEMLEAVGHENLPDFFRAIGRVLKPNGLLALQVITSADSRYNQLRKSVDWIQKYIFPGSLLPSIAAILDATRAAGTLQLHSLSSMGEHYVPTLQAWRRNFNSSSKKLNAAGFDERFFRMWNYYFCYCEAAFAMRHIGITQMLFTRPNNLNL